MTTKTKCRKRRGKETNQQKPSRAECVSSRVGVSETTELKAVVSPPSCRGGGRRGIALWADKAGLYTT